LDRRQIIGLMQGRQRDQTLDPGNDRIVDEDRCGEAGAAVDDTMADGRRHLAVKLLRQPVEDMIEGGSGIAELRRRPALIDQAPPILALGREMGIGADAFDLSLEPPLEPLAALRRKELKFDARTAGVEDQDRSTHVIRPMASRRGGDWVSHAKARKNTYNSRSIHYGSLPPNEACGASCE
jgi:hypothetical protein